MYAEQSNFEKPDNEHIKIWRYMDLAKYVSILEKQALFFPSIAMLQNSDSFEGSTTEITSINRQSSFSSLGIPTKTYEILVSNSPMILQRMAYAWGVNSWHMNELESMAMWKIYAQNHQGIAIQSTFRKLMDCFKDHKEREVMIGKVKYIDYKNEAICPDNIISHLLHKRKSFEYEREIRAICSLLRTEKMNKEIILDEKENFHPGLHLYIDINILIEKVYVSPATPTWFKELVEAVTNKYELQKEVVQSDLDQPPVY